MRLPHPSPSRHVGTALAACLATGLAVVSSSARADDGGSWSLFGTRVAGSGQLANEARAAAGFEAVSIRGGLKLVLRQGSREGVELRADANILPLIETRVVDRGGLRTLEIGTRQGVRYTSKNPVIATVDLVTLKALTVAGAGDIACDALKTTALHITVAGAADIRIDHLDAGEVSADLAGSSALAFSGKAVKLAVSISGNGGLKAAALESDDVSISVAGNGDAKVNAKKSLSVSISGNGEVGYLGDAAVSSSIAGSGRIRKL